MKKALNCEVVAESAGLEAHGLNPLAVRVMQEVGVDISTHHSKTITDELIAAADILITVCGHADQYCPVVPGNKVKLHLPFEDPAVAVGTEAEVLQVFRQVRDQIGEQVEQLLSKLAEDSNVRFG